MKLLDITEGMLWNHAGEKVFEHGVLIEKEQRVREFEVIASANTIQAVVGGSRDEDYCVDIRYQDEIEYSCECSYKVGMCKHVVAVLLKYLHELAPAKEPVALSTPTPEIKKKAIPLRKHLENLEREELIELLVEESKRSKEFNTILQLRFQDVSTSSELLKKEIQLLFPASRKEMGNFDEKKTVKQLLKLLKPLEQLPHVEQVDVDWFTVDLCLSVLHEYNYTNKTIETFITEKLDDMITLLNQIDVATTRAMVLNGMLYYVGKMYHPTVEDQLLSAVEIIANTTAEYEIVLLALQKLPRNTYHDSLITKYTQKLSK